MVDRPRGRPLQSEAITDEVLLDAVLVSFGENGFDGTSVREIARRLKVSHNLIPQRFGAKQRLWYAAVDYGFGQVSSDLVLAGQSLGDDDLLVLRGLIVRWIEVTALHPAVLQIINQEASQPGVRLDYLIKTYIKPGRDFGNEWLAKLAQQGRIKPTSATLLYFLMSHGAGGLFAMPALSTSLADKSDILAQASVKQQAEMVVDLIFDGLLPA